MTNTYILLQDKTLSAILTAANDNYPDEISNYVVLWRAVIIQHIVDATTISKKSFKQNRRLEAKRWLLYDNNSFPEICDLAFCDHQALRAIIKNLLEEEVEKGLVKSSIPNNDNIA